MKQIVVIKDSKTHLHIYKDYINIKKPTCSDNIIAYRYIEKIYINKLIDITIGECLKLAHHFDVYIIDQYGYIISKIKLDEKI